VATPEPKPTRLHISAPAEIGDVPALYSNFVQVSFTPNDLTLHLGWYALPTYGEPPPAETIEVGVRPLVKVSLPLTLIRGLIGALQTTVEAYEESFGQPMPDQPSQSNPAAQIEPASAEPREESSS
jgi:hypothetical protein